MDHVLILMIGEEFQGGNICGVFAATDKGMAKALSAIRERSSRENWEEDSWTRLNNPSVVRAYTCGCDWLRLYRREVKG